MDCNSAGYCSTSNCTDVSTFKEASVISPSLRLSLQSVTGSCPPWGTNAKDEYAKAIKEWKRWYYAHTNKSFVNIGWMRIHFVCLCNLHGARTLRSLSKRLVRSSVGRLRFVPVGMWTASVSRSTITESTARSMISYYDQTKDVDISIGLHAERKDWRSWQCCWKKLIICAKALKGNISFQAYH